MKLDVAEPDWETFHEECPRSGSTMPPGPPPCAGDDDLYERMIRSRTDEDGSE